MFSDYRAHVLGAPENPASPVPDAGVNGTRAFRTPSLRNLAATGPYMHSGALASLDDVLRFYNRAGRGQGRGRGRNNPALNVADGRPQTDPLLRELRGVRRNGEEIKAFLLALNDDHFDRTIPVRVPSGLRPGGSIN
jgi:cytochrome c peroxidase